VAGPGGPGRGLGLKLKLHVEQAGDDGEVNDAMGRLRADVDEAFKAAGNAVKDHAVREDVREVGRLLVDALDTTFSRVGDQCATCSSGARDRRGRMPDLRPSFTRDSCITVKPGAMTTERRWMP
jgi:hypothetical protein